MDNQHGLGKESKQLMAHVCVLQDLNVTCPKDWYPFPVTDHLIDATLGYHMLSFMDAYLGYN